MRLCRRLCIAAVGTCALLLSSCGGPIPHGSPVANPARSVSAAPLEPIWLVRSPSELVPSLPATDERAALAAIVEQRTPHDLELIRWWSVGGPAYRWNEIAVGELLEHFVTLSLAARHLALLHVAIDDAVAAAWQAKRLYKRRGPARVLDAAWTGLARPYAPSYPSDFAAAAAAAAEVLAYLFPDRADAFSAKAEEAMRTRLLAGVEYPSDVAAGRELGRKVAALAIEHGKRDGSDRTWAGSVPEGPGNGKARTRSPRRQQPGRRGCSPRRTHCGRRPRRRTTPIASGPTLPRSRASSAIPRATIRPCTGKSSAARAVCAMERTHARQAAGIRSEGQPVVAARSFAMLNVAMHDAAVACWDAKYAYWMIRPSHLDATVQTVFPPPNHPSYPAAHGCISTAAATILARLFPRDAETLVALASKPPRHHLGRHSLPHRHRCWPGARPAGCRASARAVGARQLAEADAWSFGRRDPDQHIEPRVTMRRASRPSQLAWSASSCLADARIGSRDRAPSRGPAPAGHGPDDVMFAVQFHSRADVSTFRETLDPDFGYPTTGGTDITSSFTQPLTAGGQSTATVAVPPFGSCSLSNNSSCILEHRLRVEAAMRPGQTGDSTAQEHRFWLDEPTPGSGQPPPRRAPRVSR